MIQGQMTFKKKAGKVMEERETENGMDAMLNLVEN